LTKKLIRTVPLEFCYLEFNLAYQPCLFYIQKKSGNIYQDNNMREQTEFTRLDVNTIRNILQKIKNSRIAVFGDFCLDVYWQIDMSATEASIETGIKTWPVQNQRYSLGGAGNVVANLRAIGVQTVQAIGVVGNDPFGTRLLQELDELNVDSQQMIQTHNPDWHTLTYCKPYIGDQEQQRLDMGNFNVLADESADKLLSRLEQVDSTVDLLVVNQQVKTGVHTSYFQQQFTKLLQKIKIPVIYDGRHIQGVYQHIWLKINREDAVKFFSGQDYKPDHSVAYLGAIAERIYHTNNRPVFITRGERGCLVFSENRLTEIPGIQVIGGIDPVGAGDSFLAGLAASVAAGTSPQSAAQIGNLAARVTVEKMGQTGTASPGEILEIGREPHFIFRPELADDARQARYYEHTDIEIIVNPPRPIDIRYAVFDHDGTLSTLRQGWEEVMEPFMIQTVLGDKYRSIDESGYDRVSQRVQKLIEQTTGMQTLEQMILLKDLVKEFGFIPEDQVKEPGLYKNLYNDRLMQRVKWRMDKLEQNELTVDDFSIKKSIEFIKALDRAGIELYLASGTDLEDVRREAKALGYAKYFKKNIFGAVGTRRKDAKKVVLEKILNHIQYADGQLITFGDGPVEIRASYLKGGITVGVASDEIRRYGLDREKRRRLIRAGAHFIIPDFTQFRHILALFHIPYYDPLSRDQSEH
jgi:rfaE bifunctional protein kinase chain/domain